MLTTGSPKKLASALAKANGKAWDADHDGDSSDAAAKRARTANYEIAGLVMHNANLIVDALRAFKPEPGSRYG
jgi:hypothetical protein